MVSKTVLAIPVYNAEHFIAKTVETCIAQTKASKVWVIDNQSTDGTLKAVKRVAGSNKAVEVFKNEKNLGRTGNWNKCLDLLMKSRFDYIKYVFSGDELFPECVEEVEKVTRKYKGLGAVAYPTEWVSKNGKRAVSRHASYANRLFSAKEMTVINLEHGGMLGAIIGNTYAKKYIGELRFSEHFTIKTDFDARLLARSKAYYLDKVLARLNLDARMTHEKHLSSWCDLEFTYSEMMLLEELKKMFTEDEYKRIKKSIVLNGLEKQYRHFGLDLVVDVWRQASMEVGSRLRWKINKRLGRLLR